jgi:hypothetical protein
VRQHTFTQKIQSLCIFFFPLSFIILVDFSFPYPFFEHAHQNLVDGQQLSLNPFVCQNQVGQFEMLYHQLGEDPKSILVYYLELGVA